MATPTIFHYTSLEALISIIDNEELWASDISYMNDALESEFAISYILPVLKQRIIEKKSLPPPTNITMNVPHDETLRAFESFLEDRKYGRSINTRQTYVVSFSETNNLLSQWRAYGGPSNCSIEFYSQDLLDSIHNDMTNDSCTIKNVKYSRPGINKINQIVDMFDTRSPRSGLVIEALYPRVMAEIASYKHPGFKEETEVRLLVNRSPTENIFYKAAPIGIVPYAKLKFNMSCIKSITIGPSPSSSLIEEAVKRMLKKYPSASNIIVDKSNTPLRR